jgi:hypothetical protein
MKTVLLSVSLFLFANVALGEIVNLNEIIRKADTNETKSLTKLLSDISLKPATDPLTGKSVFKVDKVAAGSVYDKAGVRAGDLVVMDNSSIASEMPLKGGSGN